MIDIPTGLFGTGARQGEIMTCVDCGKSIDLPTPNPFRCAACRAPLPCSICKQVDHGQQGEYPCPDCGLPYVWDSDSMQDKGARYVAVVDALLADDSPAHENGLTASAREFLREKLAASERTT